MSEGARDIHTLIAEWHDGADDGRKLHEFLGLTWDDYSTWVEGGALPEECGLYDGDRRSREKGAEELAMAKRAARRARMRLAKIHRSEYQRLFNQCMDELRRG